MRLTIEMYAEAQVDVTYGPLRLAVADMYQIDPADVTAEHVAEYERMREGE
jgi:hypothetical protein